MYVQVVCSRDIFAHMNDGWFQILEEESVLPVALWPMLAEVIIHDNPLTTTRSGPPPLLQKLLVDRLGLDLIRFVLILLSPQRKRVDNAFF